MPNKVSTSMIDGYKQSATATTRSLESRLMDSVSVLDYGAVGDGVADDTAAIQAAIDSVNNTEGGIINFPNGKYLITSTITIQNKAGIMLQGTTAKYDAAANNNEIIWGGATDGVMIHQIAPLLNSIRNLNLNGNDLAGYALKIDARVANTGWGLSEYEYIAMYKCTKTPCLITADASADGGRNHFKRCTFRNAHTATGTAEDDACMAYTVTSNVQDVFDHCEWIYKSGGAKVASTYAIYVKSTTPRIQIRNSYTVAKNGIYCAASGATPRFTISDHYSEDDNFISFPNANTIQTLRNCHHVVAGGSSVIWDGASGGGVPLIIDGGNYYGSMTLTNANAGVMLLNSPTFTGGLPTITEDYSKILAGRSVGAASTTCQGAVNAACFVPAEVPAVAVANINANLRKGSVFLHNLTANATVLVPANVHSTLDIGREIEYRITGHATNVYTVGFNAIFKLAGAAFTHSGATKTDIIRFRYDGTNWWETGRSMNMV